MIYMQQYNKFYKNRTHVWRGYRKNNYSYTRINTCVLYKCNMIVIALNFHDINK